LRAEIQRLRELNHKERCKANDAEVGAAEVQMLTERLMIALMRSFNVAQAEVTLDIFGQDRLSYVKDGNTVKIEIVEAPVEAEQN
jgi:hypothetical protein